MQSLIWQSYLNYQCRIFRGRIKVLRLRHKYDYHGGILRRRSVVVVIVPRHRRNPRDAMLEFEDCVTCIASPWYTLRQRNRSAFMRPHINRLPNYDKSSHCTQDSRRYSKLFPLSLRLGFPNLNVPTI